MDRKLTWQEHFDLVREYVVDEYLNSPDIRELMPGEIEFHIDDSDDTLNAYVYRTTKQNYRVVFDGGLIKTLTHEARLIVERSPLIFRGVDRSNKRLIGHCHVWLMFIWIDFIFHHELAHIYCGHLELVTGDARWHELKAHEEVEALPITPYQLQRIEAHADRHAASNLVLQFARSYSTVSKDIYGNSEAGRFLKEYLLAIFYLFKLLEEIAGRDNYDDAAHPAPFVRANVFWFWLKRSYPNVPGVPSLSDYDLKQIVYSAFLEFYSFEYGFTPAEITNEKMLEVDNFMQSVSGVLDSLGLNTQ